MNTNIENSRDDKINLDTIKTRVKLTLIVRASLVMKACMIIPWIKINRI